MRKPGFIPTACTSSFDPWLNLTAYNAQRLLRAPLTVTASGALSSGMPLIDGQGEEHETDATDRAGQKERHRR